MKVTAIIQARVGSTRLPGKVLKELKGHTVLYHVIERVSQSTLIDDIIIATTLNENDDAIEQEAQKCGVKVFRGSEDDVLSRFYLAAENNKSDVVVRITSDCPLIDPNVLDDIINSFIKNDNIEIATNAGADLKLRTFPRGLDVEVFSCKVLKDAYLNAKEQYQREHVTPYIYENSQNIYHHLNNVNYSNYRWTVDTEEDFSLVEEIYHRLYSGKHDFFLKEIVNILRKEPKLCDINAHIEQKKLKNQ
ncbi:MAG: glycosyltransferase family protein [Clostridiales bacterium]|nr:glycosyltransferase family protein [Clostridiales bacterium]